jgi:isopenicillin N synthase-like dioxygenase
MLASRFRQPDGAASVFRCNFPMSQSSAQQPANLARLPVIDLSGLPPRGSDARQRLAAEVDSACRDPGFFLVVNHGIPDELFTRAFDMARRFFALPEAAKAAIGIERSPVHRGWFELGRENLDPRTQRSGGDLKEGVKIGRDLPADHPLVLAGVPLHGPNQWPTGLDGFRETWAEYHTRLTDLGREIMSCFALALGLEEAHFDRFLTEPMTTAGPLHYPPFSGGGDRLSAGAHTDYGCLTLLAQHELPGLEVLGRDGQWYGVPVIEGALVVNVGDMLARWTNDRYTSTVHRVVNRSARHRYSIPFFFDPNHDTPVACLRSCLAAGEVPHYAPTTALAHLQEKIAQAFGPC